MSLGPDLDWLADPEGNLRPGAADELARPGPAALPFSGRARPQGRVVGGAVARPVGHGERVGLPRLVVPRTWVPTVVIGAALIGVLAGRWTARDRVTSHSAESFAAQSDAPLESPSTTDPRFARPPGGTALVAGMNVNLRTGPGLFAAVLWKLRPGDAVTVGNEHRGWFAVETASGVRGYVFGALLSGAVSREGRPATVVEAMRVVVRGEAIELRPGDRVLARPGDGGTATILLPSGLRFGVRHDAVALLD